MSSGQCSGNRGYNSITALITRLGVDIAPNYGQGMSRYFKAMMDFSPGNRGEKGGALGKIKEQAMDYFCRIPDGHKNAIQRPWNKIVDRSLRKMIETANKNGDCIINVGNGIYRPVPGDPVDEKELNEYLGKELHRARAIQLKRLCMKKTFEGWRDSAAYAYHSRQARQSE